MNNNMTHHNHFKKIGKLYYLTDWAGILIDTMEEVGLAFYVGSNGQVLLEKYGKPEIVNAWYEKYGKERSNAKPGSSTIVVTGAFEVEDLNKLIIYESFAKKFHDKMFNMRFFGKKSE